jgi:hypothetical protein
MTDSLQDSEGGSSSSVTYLTIKTFTEAIAAVDPQQAFGKPSKLWIAFAHFYETHQDAEDLENANLLFHKASRPSRSLTRCLSAIWMLSLRTRIYVAPAELAGRYLLFLQP